MTSDFPVMGPPGPPPVYAVPVPPTTGDATRDESLRRQAVAAYFRARFPEVELEAAWKVVPPPAGVAAQQETLYVAHTGWAFPMTRPGLPGLRSDPGGNKGPN